jgi:hypothetical protein
MHEFKGRTLRLEINSTALCVYICGLLREILFSSYSVYCRSDDSCVPRYVSCARQTEDQLMPGVCFAATMSVHGHRYSDKVKFGLLEEVRISCLYMHITRTKRPFMMAKLWQLSVVFGLVLEATSVPEGNFLLRTRAILAIG